MVCVPKEIGQEHEIFAVKKILTPTDFSDTANRALTYACELAEKFSAQLYLLYVIKEPVPYHGYDLEPEEEITEKMSRLPGEPWSEKLRIERIVRMGPPFLEIITEAHEKQVDMIVMGTHGYGPIKHMLIGSVAERVVRRAPCPVLTIRPAEFKFVRNE